MANYYRIKEITGPATVLRQGNLLNIELGDFIYPNEVDTIVSATPIVYFDDNTGEHFTWPTEAPKAPKAPAPKVEVKEPEPPVEEPAAE